MDLPVGEEYKRGIKFKEIKLPDFFRELQSRKLNGCVLFTIQDDDAILDGKILFKNGKIVSSSFETLDSVIEVGERALETIVRNFQTRTGSVDIYRFTSEQVELTQELNPESAITSENPFSIVERTITFMPSEDEKLLALPELGVSRPVPKPEPPPARIKPLDTGVRSVGRPKAELKRPALELKESPPIYLADEEPMLPPKVDMAPELKDVLDKSDLKAKKPKKLNFEEVTIEKPSKSESNDEESPGKLFESRSKAERAREEPEVAQESQQSESGPRAPWEEDGVDFKLEEHDKESALFTMPEEIEESIEEDRKDVKLPSKWYAKTLDKMGDLRQSLLQIVRISEFKDDLIVMDKQFTQRGFRMREIEKDIEDAIYIYRVGKKAVCIITGGKGAVFQLYSRVTDGEAIYVDNLVKKGLLEIKHEEDGVLIYSVRGRWKEEVKDLLK